ncbi:type I-E CRISPR-associated protein Cas7/Cse4/CasC [Bifidobacterium samirii]|uniref:Type I-E CRISPR-associated protein Cas7/Cse4/CasC n=1 Tax=Bifidobacterium samirii TaxID=2306974 RepID=A0A430FW15_9BIFI|nr:type I-E CRISPR-associated protein Cas7/Cse4/CasC [Bifidobacterium samirii]RSX58171.1 type I-E CRISPR-associated protein Cas7/Cse4/CasC [Bifidobacterium samirii]
MFIDLYIIQNVPPSNINRDDTGSPKVAYYGGALRSRVSSQAWKRAMRETFPDLLDSSRLGKRTKKSVELIGKAIAAKRPDCADDAMDMAKDVLKSAGFDVVKSDRAGADEGSDTTEYLIFIAAREIEALADLAIEWKDGSKPSKAAAGKAVAEVFHGVQAVDIALFGRMLADAPDLNTDASAQVAHAISVDKVTPEYDYFTAKDDCAPDDNAGAAMIDTLGFNSSTLYRYATVNVTALQEQLQDASGTVEGAAAFVEAFIRSMPTGKQNTFANRTLPQACVVMLRNRQPINAVDAFEDPVRAEDGTPVSRIAAIRLADRLDQIQTVYGDKPIQAWYVTTEHPVAELDAIAANTTLSGLQTELKAALSRLLADA